MNTPPNTRPVSIQPGRCLLLGLALLTVNALLPTEAAAQTNVPLLVNYQGTVTDSTGLPLGATGTVSAPVAAPVNRKIIFRFWDAATGGTRLWTEEQTVTISLGQFSVLLGQGINATGTAAGESRPALDTVFTGTGNDRFLGVTVDNGDNNITGADTEITPRQRITSVAYSLRARAADSVASTTDLMLGGSANYGLGWYGTGRLFNAVNVNGPVLYGQGGGILGAVNGATQTPVLRWNELGQVGIGTTAMPSGSELTLQGDDANAPPLHVNIRGNTDTNKRLLIGYNTTGNYGAIQAYNGASTTTALLLNQAGGSVGIGTTSPQSTLHVNGIISARPSNVNHGYIALQTGSATDDGYIEWYKPNGSRSAFMGYSGLNNLQLTLAGTHNFLITGNGSVGIGTTTPASKLDVNGQLTLANDNSWLSGGIRFRSSNGTVDGGIVQGVTGGLVYRAPANDGAAGHQFVNGGGSATLMTITNAGNVGIGTTTPGERLTVVGSGSTSASTALNVFNSSLGNLFSVRNDGNVGVGTATPSSKLDVLGGNAAVRGTAASDSLGFILSSAGAERGAFGMAGTFASWSLDAAPGDVVLRSGGRLFLQSGSQSSAICITTGNNVGIGTTNPTQGKLVISGGPTQASLFGAYINATTAAGGTGHSNHIISLHTTNSIWCGNTVIATSDERIKNILGITNSATDLSTLMDLQVTDYTYRDTPAMSAKAQKRLIAQQVLKVFPQAVGLMAGVVPDIYQKASVENGWVQLKTSLKKGDRVRLLHSRDKDQTLDVLETEGDKFRVGFDADIKQVFVYGREVNDLHTVDYDAISMLNVSATQQIKKEKDAEVKALKDENTALKARVEALEAAAKAREEADKAIVMKLAALEKLLKSSEKPAAQPVSLKRSAGGAE